MLTRRSALAFAGLASLTLAGLRRVSAQESRPERSPGERDPEHDLVATFAADGRFRTWLLMLNVSGITPYAQGAGPFTVFAGTDQAFADAHAAWLDLMPSFGRNYTDKEGIVRFIRAHVAHGYDRPEAFQGRRTTLTSLVGTPIMVDGTEPGGLAVTWTSVEDRSGSARIQSPPIPCSNGVIYPLDHVTLS